jgi:hypothetical protein
LRPLEEDLWVSPLRDRLREASTFDQVHVLRRSHQTLVALHSHETLAGGAITLELRTASAEAGTPAPPPAAGEVSPVDDSERSAASAHAAPACWRRSP